MPDHQPHPSDDEPAAGPRGVAVVTGASAGVGRAVVRLLAERGYDVALLARGRDGLEAAAEEVRRTGRQALPLRIDVSDADAVESAVEQVERELGPIDAWVNNAFTGAIAFFDRIEPHEYERITAVTYVGYVNGTRAALRRMVERDSGTVVQVGSALAYRGIPLQSAYCGAKHAIVGFTESVRVELLNRGSKVALCMVHLPGLNTPQFGWVLHRGVDHHPKPVPPIYQPEVAAQAVVHVVEHPRRSMWVGLPTALTILGNRIAPGLLDRYLARSNVKAQQAPEHDPPGEKTNLFTPVDGDAGAHGVFDDVAHERSPGLWLSTHRAAAAAGVGVVTAAGAALGRALRR